MEKKFELSKRVRKDLEQSMEEAKKTLEGKEKEIQDLKGRLRQAKEVAIREYRNSDALLSELGDSFLQGFDDALRQVQKAYPDLDVSNIKVEDQAQTSVMPVTSDDTDDLFAEVDALGDGESAQAQPVIESTHQPVLEAAIQFVIEAEQQENTSTPKQLCLFIYLYIYIYIYKFFRSVFFVFGEQFHPSWIICKHYFFKVLLIFRHVNSFVEYIHLIFSYIYGGPSSLWTLHPLGRSRPLGSPSILCTGQNFHPLWGPSSFVDCIIFTLQESVHFVDLSHILPS